MRGLFTNIRPTGFATTIPMLTSIDFGSWPASPLNTTVLSKRINTRTQPIHFVDKDVKKSFNFFLPLVGWYSKQRAMA